MAKKEKKSKKSRVRVSRIGANKSTTVTAKERKLDEVVEVDEGSVKEFKTEPAYVRVGAGVTKNMGDYESLRVDVSISAPCYREDVDVTFNKVAEEVAKKLSDEVDKYMTGV